MQDEHDHPHLYHAFLHELLHDKSSQDIKKTFLGKKLKEICLLKTNRNIKRKFRLDFTRQ